MATQKMAWLSKESFSKTSTIRKNFFWLLQVPSERSASIPHLPGPATHTTGAGRVLDGVRDPTQRSTSLAFICTGSGLVPGFPAGCHRCAGTSCRICRDGSIHKLISVLSKMCGRRQKETINY
jgi:hypothetical protein